MGTIFGQSQTSIQNAFYTGNKQPTSTVVVTGTESTPNSTITTPFSPTAAFANNTTDNTCRTTVPLQQQQQTNWTQQQSNNQIATSPAEVSQVRQNPPD